MHTHTKKNIIDFSPFTGEDAGDSSGGAPCHVSSHFRSPFVTALFERVSITFGCTSREVDAAGRHVHVINVLNGGVGDNRGETGNGQPEVSGSEASRDSAHITLELTHGTGKVL